MVDWNFFFFTIPFTGFLQEFNDMTYVLFNDTKESVKINGAFFKPSHIAKKIQQGCVLALYLFLIVVEILNTITM